MRALAGSCGCASALVLGALLLVSDALPAGGRQPARDATASAFLLWPGRWDLSVNTLDGPNLSERVQIVQRGDRITGDGERIYFEGRTGSGGTAFAGTFDLQGDAGVGYTGSGRIEARLDGDFLSFRGRLVSPGGRLIGTLRAEPSSKGWTRTGRLRITFAWSVPSARPGNLVYLTATIANGGPGQLGPAAAQVSFSFPKGSSPRMTRQRHVRRCTELAATPEVWCLPLSLGPGDTSVVRLRATVPDPFASSSLAVRVSARDAESQDAFHVRASQWLTALPVGDGGVFSITRVDHPSRIQANGAAGDLKVTWTGTPKFPVRVVYAPDSCARGMNCHTVSATFAQPTNPLVFVGALACSGTITSSLFFDYSVYLVDASGKRSPRVNADFTCVP